MSNDVITPRRARAEAVWKIICKRYKLLRKKYPEATTNAICKRISEDSSELLGEPVNRSVQNIVDIVKKNGVI